MFKKNIVPLGIAQTTWALCSMRQVRQPKSDVSQEPAETPGDPNQFCQLPFGRKRGHVKLHKTTWHTFFNLTDAETHLQILRKSTSEKEKERERYIYI